jgi:ERCC4-type nuclease
MNPFDMNDALDGMVILIDTREQDTPRLRARLNQMPCTTERRKLNFGDYSAYFPLPDGKSLDMSSVVACERKMSLDELCQCYCKDRGRFEREFVRAQEAGAKTYMLIEDATWEKVYQGHYRSKMRPSALVASILAWLARYNCQVLFCKPETSGRLIYDVLYREGKERLEAMPDG